MHRAYISRRTPWVHRVQELWPSWAFRPSESYGLCGRKATLNHWSQFVPSMSTDIRGHEALHHHQPWVQMLKKSRRLDSPLFCFFPRLIITIHCSVPMLLYSLGFATREMSSSAAVKTQANSSIDVRQLTLIKELHPYLCSVRRLLRLYSHTPNFRLIADERISRSNYLFSRSAVFFFLSFFKMLY